MLLATINSAASTAFAHDDEAPRFQGGHVSGRFGLAFTETGYLPPRGAPPMLGFDQETGLFLYDSERAVETITGTLRILKNGEALVENGMIAGLPES